MVRKQKRIKKETHRNIAHIETKTYAIYVTMWFEKKNKTG